MSQIPEGSQTVFIKGEPPKLSKFAQDLYNATERACPLARAQGKEISHTPRNSFSPTRNWRQFSDGNFNEIEDDNGPLAKLLRGLIGKGKTITQEDLMHEAIVSHDFNVPDAMGAISTALHDQRTLYTWSLISDFDIDTSGPFMALNRQHYRFSFAMYRFADLGGRLWNSFKGFILEIRGIAKLQGNSAEETALKLKEANMGWEGVGEYLALYSAAREGDETVCEVHAKTSQSSVRIDGKIAHVEGDAVPCKKPGCSHKHELADSKAQHVFIGGKLIYVAQA